MNIIRMNFYRMFRMRAFLIISLFIIATTYFISNDSSKKTDGPTIDQQIMEEAGVDEDSVGITIGVKKIGTFDEMTAELISPGILLVTLAIFVVLFSSGERNSGYLKNMNCCCERKETIFLSKIPVIVFFSLFQLVLTFCVAAAVLPERSGGAIDFAIFMGIEWLLHTAFGIFILLVMEVFRSVLAGVLIGISAAMGVGSMLINIFIVNILKLSEFGNIANYMVVSQARGIALMGLDAIHGIIPGALLSAAFLGILYGALGMSVFKKRDIN